jgi:hypothetical protein
VTGKIVRYVHWQKDSADLDFDAEDFLAAAEAIGRAGGGDADLARALEDVRGRGRSLRQVECSAKGPGALDALAATLLGQGLGTAHCRRCNRSYPAPATIVEQYRRSRAAAGPSSGRRVFCPREHALLDVPDPKPPGKP